MNETDNTPTPWTKPSLVTFIILLVLTIIMVAFSYFVRLEWAAGVALLYLLFHPVVYILDIKIKRYKVIFTRMLQLIIILSLVGVFVYLAGQYLAHAPELYTLALIVFALTLLFAGGALFLVLEKNLRPYLVHEVKEEP